MFPPLIESHNTDNPIAVDTKPNRENLKPTDANNKTQTPSRGAAPSNQRLVRETPTLEKSMLKEVRITTETGRTKRHTRKPDRYGHNNCEQVFVGQSCILNEGQAESMPEERLATGQIQQEESEYGGGGGGYALFP